MTHPPDVEDALGKPRDNREVTLLFVNHISPHTTRKRNICSLVHLFWFFIIKIQNGLRQMSCWMEVKANAACFFDFIEEQKVERESVLLVSEWDRRFFSKELGNIVFKSRRLNRKRQMDVLATLPTIFSNFRKKEISVNFQLFPQIATL